MIASVWQVQKPESRENTAILRLVEIEYRIDRARRVLKRIENQATQASKKIEQTERNFVTLRDSFLALQQEWRLWKKDQSNQKSE